MSQILLVAYGTPIFSPASLPGLKLWLKADSLALSDTDPVSTWADSSGNANNATQATGAQQPLYRTNIVNGKPVVRFDGVNDSMSFGTDPLAPTTTFVVAAIKTAAASLPAYATFIITNTNVRICAKLASGNNWGTFTGVGNIDCGEALVLDAFNDLELTVGAAAGLILYRNGTQKASDANQAAGGGTGNQIGADNGTRFLNCDIAEIIIYDTVLSGPNRILVEGYLAAKYAL